MTSRNQPTSSESESRGDFSIDWRTPRSSRSRAATCDPPVGDRRPKAGNSQTVQPALHAANYTSKGSDLMAPRVTCGYGSPTS